MKNCGDCGAEPGKLHQHGCCVERCPLCGGQLIGCDCVYEVNGVHNLAEEHPDIYENGSPDEWWAKYDAEVEKLGGFLPWTREFPGCAEAREFGFYSRWFDGKGWVRCSESDPGASPDLNRINSAFCTWDKVARRWRRP